MIALARLFLSNIYLGLMLLLLVSIVTGVVGFVCTIFKIDPSWFAMIGFISAIPLTVLVALMEGIAARARRLNRPNHTGWV